jgi:Tfp pilus assembly protein PilF
LLKDEYKAVRVSAARSLLSSEISQADQAVFDQAFKELLFATKVNSWRGEGMANQGVIAIEMNNPSEAEKAFKKAIKIEPYFEAAYINLADIYRAQQKPFQSNSILSKGIKNNPKSANLHYSYGLYFVRQKQITKAITFFVKAMTLMPENSQYAYTYILALDGARQSQQALVKLKALMTDYQNNEQLKELGLYLSQKLKSKVDYDWFMKL